MIYNVITPMVRLQYFPKLKEMLLKQVCPEVMIKWHIILDTENTTDIDVLEKNDWINFYRVSNRKIEGLKIHISINLFLDIITLNKNEKYCILCDDDFYENNFFKKINNYNEKVIICSMERGDKIPEGLDPIKAHPTNKLWACKENIKVCHVGMEQIILNGDVLSKYKLPNEMWGDGIFIVKVVEENKTAYAPEASVLFNYFEPGRWNNNE